MRIGAIMLGALVIVMFTVGMANFMGSMSTSYGTNATSVNESAFMAKAEEVKNISASMKDAIESSRVTNIPAIDLPIAVMKGLWEAARLFFATADIYTTLISDMAITSMLGMGWFTGLVLAVVGVVIVLGVLSVLHKYELV